MKLTIDADDGVCIQRYIELVELWFGNVKSNFDKVIWWYFTSVSISNITVRDGP